MKAAFLLSAVLLTGCGSGAVIQSGTSSTTAPTTAPTDAPTTMPTVAPPTAKPAAAYPVACTAEKNANQGNWGAAQQHWLDAEEQASTASDDTGVQDYELVGSDDGNIALDHLDGASKATIANDVATYQSDLQQVNADGYGC